MNGQLYALLVLAFLCSCTALSGPCTREITIRTHCDEGGRVITLPDVH